MLSAPLHPPSFSPSPFPFLPSTSLPRIFIQHLQHRGSSRGRSYSTEQKQGPWPHGVKRPAVRKGVKYTNTIKRISVLSGRHEQFNFSGGYCNSWFLETTATKWSLAECLEVTQSTVCIFSSCFWPRHRYCGLVCVVLVILPLFFLPSTRSCAVTWPHWSRFHFSSAILVAY